MSRSTPPGTRLLALATIWLCLKSAAPAASLPTLILTGIVNLPGQRCAVLEQPASPRSWDRQLILGEGQRQENIAVNGIHLASGSVHLLRFATNAATVRFSSTTNPPAFGVVLEHCNLTSVLNLYAGFRDRTILRSPLVEDVPLSLVAATTNVADAAAAIEKALNAQGIAAILDGDKFAMVVPQAEAAKAKPRLAQIKVPASNVRERELMPAGTINFPQANLINVVQIYAELAGRKLDGSEKTFLDGPQIRLKSQTDLSKEEVLYALDTLFEWQGFRMVPGDGDSIKAVAIPEK